jgi:hypothetical protein
MPAVQTTYNLYHAAAVVGMIANTEPFLVVTRLAQNAIPFGVPVVQGTGDNQVKASAAGATFQGISVLDMTLPTIGTGFVDIYQAMDEVKVLKRGVIWVNTSVAVAKGDLVYFVPATGVLTNVATANTQIPNATWDMTLGAAGLATIRIAA